MSDELLAGRPFVILVHALAGAAMFGTMFYRLLVLRPRARKFFRQPRDFEDFELTLAHGMRWTFLAGLAVIVLSGLALAVLYMQASPWWLGLLVAKSALAFFATLVFVRVSWWLWPRRVFATAEELPAFERVFARHAWLMFAIVSLAMVLGLMMVATVS